MRTQKDDVEDDDEFLETEVLTTTTRMMMRSSERMMHCRGAEGSTVEAVLAAVMVGIECRNNKQLRGRHGGQGERVLISGGIRRWTRATVLASEWCETRSTQQ